MADYDEALRRVEQLRARDGGDIRPEARTALYTHGHSVERSLVLLHGLSSSPQQFEPFGRHFYDALGYNVLIPRLPRHGHANVLAGALDTLAAEALQTAAEEAVEIARGLGERLYVAGISMGGLLTVWLAQQRDDIERAVAVAPAVGVQVVPSNFLGPIVEVLEALPNVLATWWSPHKGGLAKAPPGHYYGVPSRALAQVLRIAQTVQAEGRQRPPRARHLVLVINAADPLVDNRAVLDLAAHWAEAGADNVEVYEFPVTQGLLHDAVDPLRTQEHADIVYPALIRLIHGADAAAPAQAEDQHT